MNLKDRWFCEEMLSLYLDDDVVRLARLALAEADGRQERRYINCSDCEAWRGGCCRISPPRGSFVQAKTVGSDGCCEGFPKAGEQ